MTTNTIYQVTKVNTVKRNTMKVTFKKTIKNTSISTSLRPFLDAVKYDSA